MSVCLCHTQKWNDIYIGGGRTTEAQNHWQMDSSFNVHSMVAEEEWRQQRTCQWRGVVEVGRELRTVNVCVYVLIITRIRFSLSARTISWSVRATIRTKCRQQLPSWDEMKQIKKEEKSLPVLQCRLSVFSTCHSVSLCSGSIIIKRTCSKWQRSPFLLIMQREKGESQQHSIHSRLRPSNPTSASSMSTREKECRVPLASNWVVSGAPSQ